MLWVSDRLLFPMDILCKVSFAHELIAVLTEQEVVPLLLLVRVRANGEVESDLDSVREGDPLRCATKEEARERDSEDAKLECCTG